MNRLTNAEIADDGWPILALAGVLTIIVSVVALPVGCFLLGLMLWLAHILRVPLRQTPTSENLVIAPADGRVVQIDNCPADTGVMPLPYDSLRITIRTRPSDAQLHTSPLTGHLSAGQPLGMARLAGVTDIYLPARSHCQVTLGQHVFAAETILARLPSNPAESG